MRVETIILQRMTTGYITGCILSVSLTHLRNNLWITCMYSDQILFVFQLYFSDISEKKIGRIVQIIKREFINHCTRVYIYIVLKLVQLINQHRALRLYCKLLIFPKNLLMINEQKYPIVNIILRNDWRNK